MTKQTNPVTPGGSVDHDMVVHRNFWQSQMVQDVLPFATSLMIHLGAVLLIVLTYHVVQTVMEHTRDQAVVPTSIMDQSDPVGLPNPSPFVGDKDRKFMQDKVPDAPPDSTGWADKKTQAMTQELIGGGGGNAEMEAPIGLGAGAAGKGTRIGPGMGDGKGPGNGEDGMIGPWGPTGGGGGPVSLLGSKDNARFVAFVCDASGSMLGRFDELRAEIAKSVGNLKSTQAFNVIFFQAESAHAMSSSGLVLANAENKDKVSKFLESTIARTTTNPIPGLEIAFKQKPQLIYLLTDGDFDDNDQVLDWIRKHNADKKIKINTIAFITGGEDPEKILKQIAAENGGQYKKVTDKD